MLDHRNQTLFRGTTTLGFCTRGERFKPNSEYKEKWEFIAKEPSVEWGVGDSVDEKGN